VGNHADKVTALPEGDDIDVIDLQDDNQEDSNNDARVHEDDLGGKVVDTAVTQITRSGRAIRPPSTL
jgi:hypothetical protein